MENSGNVEAPENSGVEKKKSEEIKKAKRAQLLEKKRLNAIKRIEKEKQLILDQLSRELKYSKKNDERVMGHWLKFVNGLKSLELKKNLNEAWADFNYITDYKDNCIDLIINDRMQLEEKFQWDGEKHLELINYLMRICNSLAKSLTSVFEGEVNQMLSEYRNEGYREHMTERRKTYMENIFHATTTHAIDAMTEQQNKFLSESSDMSISHIVKRDTLRDTIVSNMNRVYAQMMSLYDDVKASSQTSDRIKVYKDLMEQERLHHENMKIIEGKAKSLEKEILHLKDEQHSISMEHNKILTKMINEKTSLTETFRKLTGDFENNQKKDEEMLKFLVVESDEALTVRSKYGCGREYTRLIRRRQLI